MSPPKESAFPVHQEDDVIASSRLVRTAVVAVGVALAAVFSAGLLLRASTGSLRDHPAPGVAVRAAGREIANIEQTPILLARDGLDLREAQHRELARTHWLDRDAGIAAIPIERAMAIIEAESR